MFNVRKDIHVLLHKYLVLQNILLNEKLEGD